MIDYKTGTWSVSLIFKLKGSVFPKSLVWAIPSAFLAYLTSYWYYVGSKHEASSIKHVTTIWSSYTFILGFLVVFRTQQAYTRYWQGAMLLRQARGEWLNAYSCCIAFCSSDPELKRKIEPWQHLAARLFSMLNCVALQTVADTEDDEFEYLDVLGTNHEHLSFLAGRRDSGLRMEVIVQWIQQHIKAGNEQGILAVSPPLLTRAFQDLSRGVVYFHQLRNFTEIQFPFPYAQMLSLMLVKFSLLTPLLSGLLLGNGVWGTILTFLSVLSFWGINYVAAEIESPFGDDVNDLPLKRMQQDMNANIWVLLERCAQSPPSFTFDENYHRMPITRQSSFSEVNGIHRQGVLEMVLIQNSVESITNNEVSQNTVSQSEDTKMNTTELGPGWRNINKKRQGVFSPEPPPLQDLTRNATRYASTACASRQSEPLEAVTDGYELSGSPSQAPLQSPLLPRAPPTSPRLSDLQNGQRPVTSVQSSAWNASPLHQASCQAGSTQDERVHGQQ